MPNTRPFLFKLDHFNKLTYSYRYIEKRQELFNNERNLNLNRELVTWPAHERNSNVELLYYMPVKACSIVWIRFEYENAASNSGGRYRVLEYFSIGGIVPIYWVHFEQRMHIISQKW